MKILKGTYDILPGEVEKWQYVEHRLRSIFRLYGYSEIRTPIIEELNLFKRSVGETTDIIQKEMYSLSDRGGRVICLRPEATASVVRSYIENSLSLKEKLSRLYYIGPMFRAEKPQKGRNRQFYQAGVEVIGAKASSLDVEVISLLAEILTDLGIDNYKIKLNNLGCRRDRGNYCGELREILEERIKYFCEDCQNRFSKNVLRIFDCKKKKCRDEIMKIPPIGDSACARCRDYMSDVIRLLAIMRINYDIDPWLVRGLDYYTSVVFEVTCPDLGAQDAIAAGGRYDNLVEDFGGSPAGAAGFALGMERLILAMDKRNVWKDPESRFKKFVRSSGLDVFLIKSDDCGEELVWKLMTEARTRGVAVQSEFEKGKSFKAQMRRANKLGAKFVGILGEDEVREGKISLKDMTSGEQRKVLLKEFVNEIKKGLES